MLKDVRLQVSGVVFALRAGILCVHDGKLLCIFGKSFDFGYVPGGAVGIGEDSAQAAAREWFEETGLQAGPLCLAGIVENFFVLNGKPWHELGMYYRMDLPPDARQVLQNGLPLLDEPQEFPEQHLEWVPLGELTARRIYPAVIRDLLAAPAGQVQHIVNRENSGFNS